MNKYKIKIEILRLSNSWNLPIPTYMSSNSSGLDLYAALECPIKINLNQISLVPTGIAISIPLGYEGQIRPRSGLATFLGLTIINSPGTIDADFRGEIKIAIINLGQKIIKIKRGDRIAQLVISPVTKVKIIEVNKLPSTKRGGGSFGHTN